MPDGDRSNDLSAWVISAAGTQVTRRFTASVEIPGWEEPPWVLLRPLTAREALRRESIGTRDEYEVGPDGEAALVRRAYDLAAMTDFDLGHCLVDFLLPVRDADGEIRPARRREHGLDADGGLLDRLPPALSGWLREAIETVNMRRPEDAAILRDAKKG